MRNLAESVVKRPKRSTFFDPVAISSRIATEINSDLANRHAVQSEVRYRDVYRKAQEKATLKKFEVQGDVERLTREAFDRFLANNRRLKDVNDRIAFNRRSGYDDSTDLGYVLRRARAICAWVLADLEPIDIYMEARHSGGVSLGVPFSDTSVKRKFQLPMTATRGAAVMMDACFAFDRTLKEAVFGLPSDKTPIVYDIVTESRATTVGKDLTARRMICIEPTADMFFQQGTMHIMYKRLAKVGLDVTSLPFLHKILAYRASVSGQNATVDFASASDSIAIELLREILPSKWFSCLATIRCPLMKVGGESVKLECFSTMGNATTFPVETLVFWSLAVGCEMRETYLTAHRNSPLRTLNRYIPTLGERRRVSVFGDDCIVRTRIAPRFIEVCEALGLLTNKLKTFAGEGPGFRESCGGDYYHGRDVRPFYLRAPTSAKRSALEPWLYSSLNGIIRSYIKYFGPLNYVYDQGVFAYIAQLFKWNGLKIKIVPDDYPDDSGLQGPDAFRFCLTYGLKPAHIAISNQGLVKFQYCRFKYWESQPRSDEISFALWLKTAASEESCEFGSHSGPWVNPWPTVKLEPFLKSPKRERGGYLVASAYDPRTHLFVVPPTYLPCFGLK